jgi:hypothetical protein
MRIHLKVVVISVACCSAVLGCKQDPPSIEPAAAEGQAPAIHQPGPAAPASAAPDLTGPGAAGANTLPPGHPPIGGSAAPAGRAAAPATQAGEALTGTVKQTIPAGKYLYIELETTTGGPTWTAVLTEPVTIGSKITIVNANLMQKFRSPTLDRTFDAIWFGTLQRAKVEAPASAPKAAAAAPEQVEGMEGSTRVADLFAKKTELTGKPVTIRGKVVKFNAQIMGRNWVHVQDGSGTAATKDHDILVTGDLTAKVGDVVTIKGTLAVDKDFGAGYSYDVLVEKSEIVP